MNSWREWVVIGVISVGGCVTVLRAFRGYRAYEATESEFSAQLVVGQTIPLEGIQFQGAARTLVVVLDRQCHYCAVALPFVRTLVDTAKAAGLQVVFLSQDRSNDLRSWLASAGVPSDQVITLQYPPSIGIPVVPCYIIADRTGSITDIAPRALTAEEGAALIRRVASPTAPAVVLHTNLEFVNKRQVDALRQRRGVVTAGARARVRQLEGIADGTQRSGSELVIDCRHEPLVVCMSATQVGLSRRPHVYALVDR
jgi:hypothetical protein